MRTHDREAEASQTPKASPLTAKTSRAVLCRICRNFARVLASPGDKPFPIVTQNRRLRFSTSAKSCPLCQMFDHYLRRHGGKDIANKWRQPGNIRMFIERSPNFAVTGALFTVGGQDLRTAVWAAEDSFAAMSGTMSSTQPLENNDPGKLAEYARPWIESCVFSHDNCRRRTDGTKIHERLGSKLPTRVIEVTAGTDPNVVKLVQPGSRIARYCALSHCWGPPNKRPYTTTQSNLTTNLSGIRMNQLSGTFQDAISLTRALGVEYLWIDSLCIIQGDEQDWLQESAVMGAIYESAYLVIAAAGSNDSTGGLFSMPRHCDLTIQAPFYRPRSQTTVGTFRLSMLSHLENSPAEGPLRTRAWTFQEWHLARRILFFMPGGMSWMCKEAEFNERAAKELLRVPIPLIDWKSTWQWLLFLRKYTRSRLTMPTDRLPAIQGLANEMQKMRPDKYHTGLWDKDIEIQLVWLRRSEHPPDDVPELPSWCWAALGGENMFLSDLLALQNDDFASCKLRSSVCVEAETNALIITGVLHQASSRGGCRKMTDCCVKWLRSSKFCLEPMFFLVQGRPYFEVWGEQHESSPIGFVIFDKEPQSNFFILPLVSNQRPLKDHLYSESVFEALQTQQLEHHSCADYLVFARGTHVEWALVLTPIDRSKNEYKRIGLSLTYPRVMHDKHGSRRQCKIL